MTVARVILIEDEQAVRLATTQSLELGGFEVSAYAALEQALPHIHADYEGIVVSDVRLPGMSGLEGLEKISALDKDLPVILITGHGDVRMAVSAMRSGAYDFIEKPFSAERLSETCSRAQEKRRLVLENRQLRQTLARHPATPELIGQSAGIEKLRQFIRHIGPTQADVLIHGATGTGKEVVARQLHLASGRTGEFVAINCGALPESVFESEIFGHEAGAFTGAQKRRIGKLEYANGGTVFLDEIESMPLALQVKLLRVLQERKLERLGGNALIDLDCRIVAATKTDLLALAAQNQFREDLYFRLAIVQLALPRLQDRREDIPLLLAHFVQLSAQRFARPVPAWTPAQMQLWQQKDWPGNVRELRNFADQLVLGLVDTGGSEPDGSSPLPANTAPDSLPRQLELMEISLISEALQKHQFQVAAAAEALGIPKKTLYDKLKKYQIAL